MQSTDTQISAHPLCGLGWIPNKINNTKKATSIIRKLHMVHCFLNSNFSKLSDLVPFEMPMHNNFYPWLETQRRLVKALKNVFEEVKQITSEYQNVKFLNKGIQSFREFIIQQFPPCAIAVNSLITGITTLQGHASMKYTAS